MASRAVAHHGAKAMALPEHPAVVFLDTVKARMTVLLFQGLVRMFTACALPQKVHEGWKFLSRPRRGTTCNRRLSYRLDHFAYHGMATPARSVDEFSALARCWARNCTSWAWEIMPLPRWTSGPPSLTLCSSGCDGLPRASIGSR